MLVLSFFLLLLLLTALVVFYVLRNKRPILGVLLSFVIVLPVVSIVFGNQIEALFYSKNDIIKDLKLANIELKNEFKVLENDISGFPERYQDTKLEISKYDRDRILYQISQSANFKQVENLSILNVDRFSSEHAVKNVVVIRNYQCNKNYIREAYFQENDHVPITTTIKISRKSNILTYITIQD